MERKPSILLVGDGAREHIIAEKLSEANAKLICLCSKDHPGIKRLAILSSGKFYSSEINEKTINEILKNNKVDFAFVSPDGLLFKGVTDMIKKHKVKVASPTKAQAMIEWDKSFARRLMKKHKIKGVPEFIASNDIKELNDFIEKHKQVAVKPAGLTGGKGVKVTGIQLKDEEEAKAYAKELLESKYSGIETVVIEERLLGQEFTLQIFTDGKNIIPMPLVQDHKNLLEDDQGPNTGGMGSYSTQNHLLPFISISDYEEAIEIAKKTLNAFYKETKQYFKGVLYLQCMLSTKGIKVIEFNSRFGDPEAINVLSIFQGNLAEVLESIANNRLISSKKVSFKRNATVCKYLVPNGYPDNPAKDKEIIIAKPREKFYFASVYEKEGKIFTTSSRAIAVIAKDIDFYSAERRVEMDIRTSFAGELYHRSDIGTQKLIYKKLNYLKELNLM
ncbi:MAG: phosphoribosylamine--glycine ligase [Candidatus Micrarchaeota archaeon]|nr:phosphoribosylamine--glycine ligase [Candidatus Micrarchaeota archaeon]